MHETPRRRLFRFVHRFAAAALVCAFAALPTFARAYDRLTSTDNPTAFKISKNLERPHEKIGAAPIVRTAAATLPVRDDAPAGRVCTTLVPVRAARALPPTPDRAPPAR